MKPLWWMQGPLMDAEPAPSGGGDPPVAGDPKPGAFDPAAFKADMIAEVNKAVNGAVKGLKTDMTKLFKPSNSDPNPPSPDPSPAPSGDPKPTDPAIAAQVRALERQNKELLDRFNAMKTEADNTKTEADKKELNAAIRTKLSGKFKFADEAALEDAFEIFSPKVKRDENGAIVGHDGTPVDQYLEEQMRNRAYLLAPKDVNGAGARTGGRAGSHKSTLDDIDNMQKLSPEDRTRLRQDVADAMAAAQSGR